MQHTHLLDELLEQARAHQDEERNVSYAHQWYSGVYVQIIAIGLQMAIFTIGAMMPDELPLVTDDYQQAAEFFEEQMQSAEAF